MPTTITGTTIVTTSITGSTLNLTGNQPSTSNTFFVKAYATFNGGGGLSILESKNVSSVTRGATGFYTINFITPLSGSNYAVLANSNYYGGYDTWVQWSSTSPTSASIAVVRAGALNDASRISVAFVQ